MGDDRAPVVQQVAAIGRLDEFNASSDSITAYVERAQLFMDANSIPNDKKVAVFLSAIGGKTYSLLRNLLTPTLPKEKSFEDIVSTLKSHFEPKPLEIVERFNFNRKQQGSDETVAQYVAELRRLSTHCNYGTFLDAALRDRFVCGLKSEATQKKLLTEADLTFSGAVKIALSMETATTNTKQMHSSSGSSASVQKTTEDVCKIKVQSQKKVGIPQTPQRARKAGSYQCYRCGNPDHKPHQCPFKTAKCHNCDKIGHIQPVCRLPRKRHQQRPPKTPGRSRVAMVTTEVESEEDSDLALNHIRAEPGKPYLVDISLNGKQTSMELDTGASLSLMSETKFKDLFPNLDLQPSTARLVTYSQDALRTLGEVSMSVVYGDQKANLPLVVVSGSGPTLLGRNWLSKIRLDWASINIVEEKNLDKVLKKYAEVFKPELGTLKGYEAKIYVDSDAQPRYCKARTVPYALRGAVEKELQRLESEGIIEPVQFAEWAAPIVPVVKSDKKSVRICGDFSTTVNRVSKLDKYPIPKIEDLHARLAGGKLFTKLDMSQAYQQIVLDKDSRKFVVVNTHRGLFQYNRLPFGVSSAPGIFQRVMESLLEGIPGVVVYIDDILVTGCSDKEHMENLERTLHRLSEAGLRLKKEKCVFLAKSVQYLGYVIDAEGLHPMPEKVKAVQEAPNPTNVTELKSYLGLLSYYSKFLPNLSTVLAPLYVLLRDKESWHWGKKEQKSFNESKQLLVSSQVLVHFDPKLEIRLACDASEYGLGAVLSHIMPDGTERPVGFVSRTLSSTEKKYSQIEKEALACVVGVTRFHAFLWGHHFTLQTDHKPLLSLLCPTKLIPCQAANRIQRWAWTLSSYEYTITWRRSAQHSNADALSRLPLAEVPTNTTVPAEVVLMIEELQDAPLTSTQIATWTRRDPLLAKVLRYVLEGWPTYCADDGVKPYWTKRLELSAEAGCLIWGGRVVIPPKARQTVLVELHSGHPGVSRMKAFARGLVWWPGIDKDVEDTVRKCDQCQRDLPMPPSAPLRPWSWPTRPWSRLHIDYAGPMAGKMFLVVIDSHSKWIEVFPLSVASAQTTIQKLRQLFSRFGIPESIVSDNGPQFVAAEFEEFCRSNGIQHTKVAPYHPSSNGLAERAVQVFKQGFKKQTSGSLEDKLSRLLFQYRITPHTTTGVSPAELLLGKKLRSRLDFLKPSVDRTVHDRQMRQKVDHDRHSKERFFTEGENVYVKNHGKGDKWIAGEIVKKTGPLSFHVKLTCGRVVRYHQDQLRKRYCGNIPTQPPTADPGEGFSLPTFTPTVPETLPQPSESSTQSSPEVITHPEVSQSSAESVPEIAQPAELPVEDPVTPQRRPLTSPARVSIPDVQYEPKKYPTRVRKEPDWFHKQHF